MRAYNALTQIRTSGHVRSQTQITQFGAAPPQIQSGKYLLERLNHPADRYVFRTG
jgi:hypothetical protein